MNFEKTFLYPKDFGLHVGGKAIFPLSLVLLSDRGKLAQPTPVQIERRRVFLAVCTSKRTP
ncbi:TPA: hypothetical protein DCX24_08320 [Candidatus Azambacteria bacterium]|nr:hypothetical protein [Candidatus Azambacteria bacterium]